MNDKVKAVSGLIKAYATLHAPNSLYSIEEFSKTTNWLKDQSSLISHSLMLFLTCFWKNYSDAQFKEPTELESDELIQILVWKPRQIL